MKKRRQLPRPKTPAVSRSHPAARKPLVKRPSAARTHPAARKPPTNMPSGPALPPGLDPAVARLLTKGRWQS